MQDPNKTHLTWLWPTVTFVLGFVALAIDLPVARWCLAGNVPAGLKEVLQISETFGHGIGIVLILITIAVLDPARRWALPRLVMASLGAGLIANIGKLAVARIRPHHGVLPESVWATFHEWMPMVSGPSYEQSVPSSHTASAVGLAIGLGWLYPRGRWWFAILALLVALQRVEVGAHFLSDALWGSSVGFAVGTVTVQLRSLGYLGNKLERWLKSKKGANAAYHSPQSAAS